MFFWLVIECENECECETNLTDVTIVAHQHRAESSTISRNQKTCLKECNSSFMYRKSPNNVNKVHKFIYINNKVQRMSTNIYQQTRALRLRGCAESQTRYTVSTQLQWILATNCLQDSGECMRLSIVATPHVLVNV